VNKSFFRPGPRIAALLAMIWTIATAAGSPARADFFLPTLWTRGDARSTYQQWDVFVEADGDPANVPDIGEMNSYSTDELVPNVRDTTGLSFITGGNIYSFSVATEIDVIVPNAGLGDWYHTTVILQTRTKGSEIDTSAAKIAGIKPVQILELSREPAGGPFGDSFTVDTLFRWELPGNLASYLIEFPALGSSMSLDRVAVDTLALLEGDANRDATVNIFDINLVSAHWNEAGPSGDVNFDGAVNIFDINLISSNWNHAIPTGASPNATAVPEPATWGLALAGALGLAVALARRRKLRKPLA